jgi:hypothetical protein
MEECNVDNEEELQSAATYLKWIHQEMKTLRQLTSELVRFSRDAESEIPEYMRRFANYMHDLHDIAYMYSEIGQEPPQWIKDEQQRCDDRLRQLLKKEHAEGTFGKVRAEMAKDEDNGNRWDHTKALTFRRPDHENPGKS